jgi:alcohol dehydrogenase class IV
VLGGMYETAPHGAICAALLPHVFRANAEKLGILYIFYIRYEYQNYNIKTCDKNLVQGMETFKLLSGNKKKI